MTSTTPLWGKFAALVVMTAGLGLAGCEQEESGTSCSNDGDCQRGQFCDDGTCTEQACRTINECPAGAGESRTCLLGLGRCSRKECADVVDGQEVSCPGERPICITREADYAHHGTCVAEGTVPCADATECGGLACCNGVCQAACADSGIIQPRTDAGPDATPGDAGTADAAPDMGGPQPGGGLCRPCGADADCAELGAGARCTPFADGAYCTSACAGDGDCPEGYDCIDAVGQCLPAGLRCTGCLVDGCGPGEVCDFSNGQCTSPRDVCGTCRGDAGCRDGLTCGPLGNNQYCLTPCPDGQCGAGFTCADGLCKPQSGMCDACQGQCGAATPYCVPDQGRCAACGPGHPCGQGLNCNPQTFACEEGGGRCNTDLDCQGDAARPICFGGNCIGCLQDSDCAPRNACNPETRLCEANACAGVVCQRGAACDPATGRCNPGCQGPQDCAAPDIMSCNGQTGQCYYTDGACDVGGGDGVCAPGGTCNLNPLDPMMRGICSCEKENPADFTSPDRIGCQPGHTCLQFQLDPSMPAAPGICLGGF